MLSRRSIERALIAVGLVCLGWAGLEIAQTARFQRRQQLALERAVEAAAPSSAAPAGLVGRLEIPRLHLSVAVMEGDGDSTLKRAIGHLPDSSLPWDGGNTVLAAHRDTFFRPLKDIRAGDELRLTTPRGTFFYWVRETHVVQPHDVSVLAPTEQPALTLVTCYPFFYVGAAPKRFVVRAQR